MTNAKTMQLLVMLGSMSKQMLRASCIFRRSDESLENVSLDEIHSNFSNSKHFHSQIWNESMKMFQIGSECFATYVTLTSDGKKPVHYP